MTTNLATLINEGLARGSSPALISGDTEWSRAQLATEISNRATALRDQGVVQGDLVGINLPRGADLVAWMCAVHEAGGAYVPLDPSYPSARLDFMREDSGARFEVNEYGIKKLPTGRVQNESAHLAYLIYTSGSTGQPKGVAVTHHNAVNFLLSMMERPGIGSTDRLLAVTTPSFDISVLEIFGPLAAGGTLIMAGKDDIRDGARLANLIAKHDVTLMQATPSSWRLLLEAGWTGQSHFRALCGGEALPRSLAKALLDRTSELWNMYGPTETTVWSSCAQITDADDIHLGTPIKETDILIFDEDGARLSVNLVGEIAIGGTGVTEGYWQRPELTAQKFITAEGTQLFLTGDGGSIDEEGRLHIRGRLDRQIKLRGFRIEPEEVERVLTSIAGVEHAVVTIDEEDGVPSGITAHIAPELDATSILASANEKLPPYMVPSRVMTHDALPLLPNGKIDRAQLAHSSVAQQTNADTHEKSETETIIAKAFAEILKCDVPDSSANFFELGGHSLLAARVLAVLRKETDTKLTLKAFFEAESISALAKHVDDIRADEVCVTPEPQDACLRGQESNEGIALTPLQDIIWSHGALHPDIPLYIIPAAWEITGQLDVRQLTRAYQQVAKCHDAFRLRIEETGHGSVQTFDAPLPDLKEIDLSANSEGLEKAIRQICRTPIDLVSEAPIRAAIAMIAPDQHFLLMGIHHLAWDGSSFGIFLEDLAKAYQGQDAVTSIGFASHVRSGQPSSQSDREWWKNELETPPAPMELPTDCPYPTLFDQAGAVVPITVDDDLLTNLRQLASEQRTTSSALLLTVFSGFFAWLNGTNDRIIGVVSDERPAGFERTIGCFVNTLLLRDKTDTSLSLNMAVRQTMGRLAAVLDHPLPVSELLTLADFDAEPSRPKGAQVIFRHQFIEDWAPDIGQAKVRRIDLEQEMSAVELSFNVLEATDNLKAEFEYASSIFSKTQANALAVAFETFLKQTIQNAETSMSSLIVETADMQAAYDKLNKTNVEGDAPSAVNSFLERVSQNPDKPALIFREESISYDQLNYRAKEIANGLLAHGVKTGDVIGISLERSPDLIACVYAVWMTGATFLPLDPEHPAQRLSYMVEDAGCRLIIGTGAGQLTPEELASSSNDEFKIEQGEIAYIMYTSGSTGKPKGVVNGHRQVANFLRSMSKMPGCSVDDRLLAVTTLGFDISILELFLPLSVGATVILPDADEAVDGDALCRLATTHDATIMQGTPATWRLMLDAGWEGQSGLTSLCGGEPLPPDLITALLPRVSALWNMYGPTETTVWSTVKQIKSVEDLSIGTPIDNTQTYVVSPAGQLCPPGVPGELWIGGEGVAMGYHGKPDLTSKQFTENPFSNLLDQRVYRTGDKVRLTPEGELVHLGRMDTQLKLRGFRIEAGEIEAALVAHDDIAEAVTVIRTQANDEKVLVAYFTMSGIFAPTGSELRRWLRERLPQYMVPQLFVELERLPLTPNGKIDRLALPAPAGEYMTKRDHVPPQDGLEQKLAEIWAEVLSAEIISASDNFFELGGQSLQAARVAAIFKSRTGAKIQPRALIFETLAQLVAGAVKDAA